MSSNSNLLAEGAGIGVVSVVGFVVLSAVAYQAFNGNLSGVVEVISPFIYALANFIPFGLIMFGFIADVFGQEYRFSIPSIMAVMAVLLNRLISLAETFAGLPPRTETGESGSGVWCFIPGMEGLESRLFPMNFVIMGSILTYYLISAGQARSQSSNISMYVAFFLIPILQASAFYLGGCSQWYAWGALGLFGAWVLGIMIGASTYGVIRSTNSVKLPFGYGAVANSTSGDQSGAAPLTAPSGSPLGAPQTGAKCSAANTDDDNAYVCEAYKNGVLVTEKIS